MEKQKKNRKKTFLILLVIVLALLIGMQFVRPEITNPPVTGEVKVPHEVQTILKNSCYDCHSNETQLTWYDKIAPAYWLAAQHVKDGRKGLNFSEWDKLAPADQKAKLWESVNQITQGAMPLSSYTMAHPNAKISQADLNVLKKYIWSLRVNNVPQDTAKIHALKDQTNVLKEKKSVTKNPKTINGIGYIDDYKKWAVVSTTQRLDNGTMRIIYGNDIAVKAIKDKKTNPWPNGTILAKAAYDEIEDADGNISQGVFKQVEYMIKDDQKYENTYGWGFARFKTTELTPYGKRADFVIECMNCHQPMKKNDYVFTLPIQQ